MTQTITAQQILDAIEPHLNAELDPDLARCTACGNSFPRNEGTRDEGYIYCAACAEVERL